MEADSDGGGGGGEQERRVKQVSCLFPSPPRRGLVHRPRSERCVSPGTLTAEEVRGAEEENGKVGGGRRGPRASEHSENSVQSRGEVERVHKRSEHEIRDVMQRSNVTCVKPIFKRMNSIGANWF